MKIRNNLALYILLIIILSFVVRVYNLGGEYLWIDEGVTVYNSQKSISHNVLWGLSDKSYVPVYQIILPFWEKFFGVGEFSVRFPSVVFGTLAVYVAFLIGTLTIQTNSNISAQEGSIPSWIKINAGFWANNQISDTDFLNGIEYLIGQEIIQVSYEIPQAVAEVVETSSSTTKFYVVTKVIEPKFDNVAMYGPKIVYCEKGDTVLSGGYEINVGEIWAYNSFPIKSSEDLSYHDGWLFNFYGKFSKGSLGVSMYLTCADTNL